MKKLFLKTLIFIVMLVFVGFLSAFISFLVVVGRNDSDGIKNRNAIIESTLREIKDTVPREEEVDQRINFLIIGKDESINDLNIFASFDVKKKELDLIFIPRDTFYQSTGGTNRNIDKIGELYSTNGIVDLKDAISNVMRNVPIHYYIVIDYNGFENIIDSIGGVPITITQPMYYEDPYQKIPLVIDFKPGSYTLNGKNSLKFIRYLNSSTAYRLNRGDDLGRIEAIQGFVMSGIEKSLSTKLPVVFNTAYKYIESDMTMGDLTRITTTVIGMKKEGVRTLILPGYMTPEKYYVLNQEEIGEMLQELKLIKE